MLLAILSVAALLCLDLEMHRAFCVGVCKWVDSWLAIQCQVVVNGFTKAKLKIAATEVSDSKCEEDTDELFLESDMFYLFCSYSPGESDFDRV